MTIIIPARMASTRFPNKPLANILGKTMIERVWQIANQVQNKDAVFIATDDEKLKEFTEKLGASVIMTDKTCATGTDRVAQAAKVLELNDEIVFSFQADAVLTPPWIIESIIDAMKKDSSIEIATAAVLLEGEAKNAFIKEKKMGSSTGTCVIFDKFENALYFSKALIPCSRTISDQTKIYRHIGLYGYRYKSLQNFASLEETPLEKEEKLEQLRALEHGMKIRVVIVDYKGRTHGSVDREEDVVFVESIIQKEGELILCN